MAEYIYPANLRQDAYKFRKVTITVKNPDQDSNAAKAADVATNAFRSASDYVTNFNETAEQLAKNLEANNKARKDRPIDTIVLPLPNQFTDRQDHTWSQESGILGTMGKELLGSSFSGVAEKIGGKNGGFIRKVLGGIAKTAGSVTADQALASAAASAGLRKPLFDPGYFQNYSGTNPRSFDVEWDLVPTSPEEAEAILTIVMKLKQYASPTKTIDGVSLLAPHYFSIVLSNKYITKMIKLDRVVITNISVNYGADGNMQQTSDGMPKHMTLSLALQEVDMTTSQDYSTLPNIPYKRYDGIGI
jgi:hypothetical protein